MAAHTVGRQFLLDLRELRIFSRHKLLIATALCIYCFTEELFKEMSITDLLIKNSCKFQHIVADYGG